MPKASLTRPRATRGKTVGKTVIKSFIHDILHGHEPGFKPLYTQSRFNAMVEGLQSEREYTIYLQYVSVYNGISEELVRSQAYAQQAQHGLGHLQALLAEARRAEEQAALLSRLEPLYGLPLDRNEAKDILSRLRGMFISLDMIAADAPMRATIQSYHDMLLMPALRGLAAYNTLLALLAEALDIPELTQLNAPMDDIQRDLDAYAADIAATRALLSDKSPKRDTLDALFIPASMEDAAPSPVVIDAVRSTLSLPDVLQTGIVQQLFVQLLGAMP